MDKGWKDTEKVNRSEVVVTIFDNLKNRVTYGLLGRQKWETYMNAIKLGVTRELAANAIGLLSSTVTGWIERGENGLAMLEKCVDEGLDYREYIDPMTYPYILFVVHLYESEGQAVSKWMELIEKAATNGDWRAAAWKAERVYPNQYRQHVSADNQIAVRGEVEFTADVLAEARNRAKQFDVEATSRLLKDGDANDTE